MSDFVRFHGSGTVTQVQELSTMAGKPFARLHVGIGGNAGKADGVIQVDFWGDQERESVLQLQRGQRVLVLGRVSGRISDKGYWNATMFGDAVFADRVRSGAQHGGRVKLYAHGGSPAPAAAPQEADPSSPGGYAEASEDIPF